MVQLVLEHLERVTFYDVGMFQEDEYLQQTARITKDEGDTEDIRLYRGLFSFFGIAQRDPW